MTGQCQVNVWMRPRTLNPKPKTLNPSLNVWIRALVVVLRLIVSGPTPLNPKPWRSAYMGVTLTEYPK